VQGSSCSSSSKVLGQLIGIGIARSEHTEATETSTTSNAETFRSAFSAQRSFSRSGPSTGGASGKQALYQKITAINENQQVPIIYLRDIADDSINRHVTLHGTFNGWEHRDPMELVEFHAGWPAQRPTKQAAVHLLIFRGAILVSLGHLMLTAAFDVENRVAIYAKPVRQVTASRDAAVGHVLLLPERNSVLLVHETVTASLDAAMGDDFCGALQLADDASGPSELQVQPAATSEAVNKPAIMRRPNQRPRARPSPSPSRRPRRCPRAAPLSRKTWQPSSRMRMTINHRRLWP
jgi:hypothetical protein